MKKEKRDYKEYLASREWAQRREAVLKRAGGTCERCKRAPADCVHHLTYKNVCNEPLTDLQALCDSCHKYLSAKSDHDPALDLSPPSSVMPDEKEPPDGKRIQFDYQEGYCDDGDNWLKCPRCGEPYLHHGTVRVNNRAKEDGPGTTFVIENQEVKQEPGQFRGRRDDLSIEFYCEYCDAEHDTHVAVLSITQHKGITICKWELSK